MLQDALSFKFKNFSKSFIANVIFSMNSFLLIFISNLSLTTAEISQLSLFVTVLYGGQLIYLPFFYYSEFNETKFNESKDHISNLDCLNFNVTIILGFFLLICFLIFSSFEFLISFTGVLYVVSQLIFDHQRMRYSYLGIEKMPILQFFVNFLLKLAVLLLSENLLITLFVLTFINIYSCLFLSELKIFFIKNITLDFKKRLTKYFNLTLSALLNWLYLFSPIFLAGLFYEEEIVGALMLVYTLANLVSPIVATLDTYFLSEYSKTEADKIRKNSMNLQITILVLFTIMILPIHFFADYLFIFLGKNSPDFYTKILFIYWIAVLFQTLQKDLINCVRILFDDSSVDLKVSIAAIFISIICIPIILLSHTYGLVTFIATASFIIYLFSLYSYYDRIFNM